MTGLPQKLILLTGIQKKIIDRVLNEQLKPLVTEKEVSHISVFALTHSFFNLFSLQTWR